jgi:hypothetical protein
MKTTAKRMLAGLAVVVALAGGIGFHADEAAAKTRVLRSADGKLMLVCVYDDDTGELAYCDVYWLGFAGTGNAGVLADFSSTDAPAAGGTRLPAGQIAIDGNAFVVDGAMIDGAPDTDLVAKPAKDPDGKGKGGKHKGKGGKGRNR